MKENRVSVVFYWLAAFTLGFVFVYLVFQMSTLYNVCWNGLPHENVNVGVTCYHWISVLRYPPFYSHENVNAGVTCYHWSSVLRISSGECMFE